jgi:hypothetical protein
VPFNYWGSGYGDRLSDNISKRELRQYELIFLNRWQLRIIRSAFFAVYKYRFNDAILIEMLYDNFGDRGWSIPDNWFNANFKETTLSPTERRNIEIIQNLENMIR